MIETDLRIVMLPKNTDDPIFEQRESGRAHTPFEVETEFYNCIRMGDVDKLRAALESYLKAGAVVVGRLSKDNLRQMRYVAVSSITLGTRYAIMGGLDEFSAYNLSDAYIQQIDRFESPIEIMEFIMEKAEELTALVEKSKYKQAYPASVKRALHYINKHLNGKITLKELADECGLSPDYFSALFKKAVGENVSSYVLRQKLEASKALLNSKYDYSSVGYYFGFCSETYYITCFKREYGMTPRRYAQSLNY